MKTLGKKLRNPLNIRYNKNNKWVGQRGSLQGFCVFVSLEAGYRAAAKLLCNYLKGGNKTIRSIISRWAPDTENDTESYINYVCSNFGSKGRKVSPDYVISQDHDLIRLIRAMSILESGTDPYLCVDLVNILDTYNIHV